VIVAMTSEIQEGQPRTRGRVISATMSTPRMKENIMPGGMAPIPTETMGPP